MLAALDGAQAAGGDARGVQSAALLIVKPLAGAAGFSDRAIDIRVDDNKQPLAELRRLLNMERSGELVTEAYDRRCAVTGEKTLPVLEAAHIKPYASDGPHRVSNGILLRSDLHKLFDLGYVTVTPDLRLEVSPRLRTEWQNGREYYAHHGQQLRVQPADLASQPSREFLTWHNENRFRA